MKLELLQNTKRDKENTKGSDSVISGNSRRFDLRCKTSESLSILPKDQETVSRNAVSNNSLIDNDGISTIHSDSKAGKLTVRNNVSSYSDSLKRPPRNGRQTVLPQISNAADANNSPQPSRQRTTFGMATNNRDSCAEGTTPRDRKSNDGRKRIEGEYV